MGEEIGEECICGGKLLYTKVFPRAPFQKTLGQRIKGLDIERLGFIRQNRKLHGIAVGEGLAPPARHSLFFLKHCQNNRAEMDRSISALSYSDRAAAAATLAFFCFAPKFLEGVWGNFLQEVPPTFSLVFLRLRISQRNGVK